MVGYYATHPIAFSLLLRRSCLACAWTFALAGLASAGCRKQAIERASYVICESVHADVPWRADVVKESYAIDLGTRTVTPNSNPGLGVSVNEEEVRKHPFQEEIKQRVFYPDGSVGDW